jgi:MerR family transcriptional regulator, thiopeptide resistance regulator
MRRTYRVGEFAALTGVSVRTLHHYDAIGLLRPNGYSEGRHRLYAEDDLLRLQQILTLRYLGFSLRQIGDLLDRPDFDLVASLRVQRLALRDRISELERIEAALCGLLEHRLAAGRWDWNLVAGASASVQDSLAHRSEAMEKMQQYYTPEEMKQFEELGRRLPPEEIRAIEQGWTDVIAEVRANRGLDPASSEARAITDRWNAMFERTKAAYAGAPGLWSAIGENIREGRFAVTPQAPSQEDFAFIERVNEARDT